MPLDYAKPRGRTLGIAISRVPATGPARRGVMLSNPGGPGGPGLGSTVGFSRIGPPPVKEAFAQYDLVGFDPRGTGRSNPISCGLTDEQIIAAQVPFPFPGDAAMARSIAASCGRNAGDLLRHLTTANVARDMNLLRRALGEEKISFYGNSYGTYVGIAYAGMFARHTDRVTLDSNVDSEHGWYHQNRLIGRATERRFDDFAAWAAARGFSGARARFLALGARLDKRPERVGALTVDGRRLRMATYALLRSDATFPSLAGLIQFLDRLPGAPAEHAMETLLNTLSKAATAEGDREASAYLAVQCADTPWPSDLAIYQRNTRMDARRYPITQGGFANANACTFWTGAPNDRPVTADPRGPRNILMLNNTRDRISDLGGALATRRALGPRAAFVTVEGWNHGILGNGNTCADTFIAEWLGKGVLPDKDTYCPPPTLNSLH
ncbi:alpha/beta hydrolase [Nonomuraea fuscirosea]|uniref:alpha/beta fold hydrolase n=1 Tax=Nonomuraea fuscirosea TaxID=1291556 RepID=UPI002DDB3FC0|nr:alpha/beta fold hydrolase [Nonomuraea fuscirosea]WSA52276.1 alpha/beta hydrolase [Nonomuraea fuscirosea]